MRECISHEERCCFTLRYLARGESFRSLEYQFRISDKAILYSLRSSFCYYPSFGKRTFENIENYIRMEDDCGKFYHRWNFANGFGGFDGKHIVLQEPKNSGSYYRNYKGSGSIILMGMIGPECEFLFANLGMNDSNSDGGNGPKAP